MIVYTHTQKSQGITKKAPKTNKVYGIRSILKSQLNPILQQKPEN